MKAAFGGDKHTDDNYCTSESAQYTAEQEDFRDYAGTQDEIIYQAPPIPPLHRIQFRCLLESSLAGTAEEKRVGRQRKCF